MLGLAHRGFKLNDYDKHVSHTLERAGYSSALVGVQHLAKDPSIIGYDEIVATALSNAVTPQERKIFRSGKTWRELPSSKVENAAPVAAEYLHHNPPQPFFLSIGFSETHRRYPEPGSEEEPKYSLPPPSFPDYPETRADMAGFKASARILDEGVGTVLEALDETGLADNTLVICTTDHGIAFPTMKCNLTDGGIGVMLIIRGPGGFSGGKPIDAMISQIDIFPTLCELVGLDTPGWLEGRSIMPLLRGETEKINDQIFAEVNYHASYEPVRAVRTTEWKYVRRFGDRRTPVLTNCDDSPTKELWIRHGWRNKLLPSEGLYNLVFDPHETYNLAGDPSAKDVLDDLRYRLERWMKETKDPMLQGPIPAPSGARINDPNGTSSKETRQIIR
jgi:arylsulfatase A-like enzyme